LKLVCEAARESGIEVSMCGEMAAEPLYVPVMLGLGLNELSMNHACIPRVKRVLRNLSRTDGQEILHKILQFSTGKEIATHLDREMRRRLPDIFGDFVI